MARRRESGLDVLAALPWPVGIGAGLLAYWAVRYGAAWYFGSRDDELAEAFSQQLRSGALAPLAWAVLILCWIAAGVSYLRSRQRARLLETRTGLDSITALDWREFEQLVGEAFRRQGYSIEETGLGGADGGVDLVLRREGRTWLVQCKRWRQRQVPVATVREMWGLLAHHAADGVKIVCVGDYTPDARRFASEKAIDLITGRDLVAMVDAVRQTAPSKRSPILRIEPTLAPSLVSEPAQIASPPCPKCPEPMVRRTNRQTGSAFRGCTAYPHCKGTRMAEAELHS
ncbi:restriction endonuclease [Lysobacter korlensis]|uniref:Restriction endonuclease n=1 Tax=Lysobacter korlensis TaxID=553636 RepID=A0ABV6RS59_9GAMM